MRLGRVRRERATLSRRGVFVDSGRLPEDAAVGLVEHAGEQAAEAVRDLQALDNTARALDFHRRHLPAEVVGQNAQHAATGHGRARVGTFTDGDVQRGRVRPRMEESSRVHAFVSVEVPALAVDRVQHHPVAHSSLVGAVRIDVEQDELAVAHRQRLR